jgi:hypothetical protein
VLKKRSSTRISVPRGPDEAMGSSGTPPSSLRTFRRPSATEVARVKRETDAMLGNASPRNPRVPTSKRSSDALILLVACL